MGRKYQPGESGNPDGSTVRHSVTEAIRMVALEEITVTDKDGKNPRKIKRIRAAAEAAWDKDIAGDISAFKELADRCDGKVKDVVQHEGTAFDAFLEMLAERRQDRIPTANGHDITAPNGRDRTD